MAPPLLHPLPSRPSTGHPPAPRIPPSQASPAINAGRNPFFSQPQPASPRPPVSPFAQGSSPKFAVAGAAGSGPLAATSSSKESPQVSVSEEPIAWAKKALGKDDLGTNSDLLALGEGWTAHWRNWRGPALVAAVPAPPPPPPGTSAAPRTALARSQQGQPPQKRARMSAFDELLAEELSASAAASSSSAAASPVASTSQAPSHTPNLKEHLQSLHLVSPQLDPVEKARLHVLATQRGSDSTRRLLALFPHVKVAAPPPDDVKGKGKAKEEGGGGPARVLWVFSVTKGPDPSNPAGEDQLAAPAALSALEFEGLTSIGSGSFSHRDLFPSLYPTSAPPVSPLGTPPVAPTPSAFLNPPSRSVKSFLSAIELSQELHPDLSSSNGTAKTRAPAYEAFVSAATEALLVSLLAEPPPSSTTPSLTSRLGDHVVFLPAPSEPFGTAGRRIVPRAVQTTVRLSLQRKGIFIQTIVNDIALRPFPLHSPPLPDSPVLLAPFGTPARFVKVYPPSASAGADSGIYQSWASVVEGSGVALAPEETWLLCRIDLPPTTLDEPSSDSIEVVWPASLCLLDGTKPQPRTSPSSTPPRPKAPDLAGASPESTQSTKPDAPALVLAPFDIVTRRRFASVLRRRPSRSAAFAQYRDPIGSRAEKVGLMLEEMAEQREKKEREDREREEADALAAAAPPPTTVTALSATNDLGTKQHVLAAAPINMRTPISLGGSSTEAPSPADGFPQLDQRHLGGFLAQLPVAVTVGTEPLLASAQSSTHNNPEADQLYPSPPDASRASVPPSSAVSMPVSLPSVTDNVFAPIDNFGDDFDWDDFGQRGQSGMQQDFDDGMGNMMGLTDDDFSFFDDPAPVASLPASFGGLQTGTSPNFGGLQSSGPSPKFVDHFSHLGGGTPFASAGSPVSPFTHSSPHLHHSPGILGFPYDPHTPHMSGGNALGLGAGTPGGPLALAESSPFKTPRTPYSPFVELTDDPASVHEVVSIAGTPAVSRTSGALAMRPAGLFDPVQFGKSHGLSDGKYDPRKGKFGLPSPPEYDMQIDRPPSPMVVDAPALAAVPWYGTVCDPRVTAAVELRRRRTPSLLKIKPKSALSKSERSGTARVRTWVRAEVDSDHCGEDESEDDEMDLDEDAASGTEEDALLARLGEEDAGPNLDLSFGPALVLLRQHLTGLLDTVPRAPLLSQQPSKANMSADLALSALGVLVSDQAVYNPDFRAHVTDALLLRPSAIASSKLVSSYAINLVRERLTGFSTRNRIPEVAPDADTDMEVVGSSEAGPLTDLVPPTILLRAQQSIMQMRTSAVRFWRPMGFEPLTGPKNVVAFALYEEGGEELNVAVKAWLHRVSDAYRASRLGEHSPGSSGTIEEGLAMVPSGSLSHSGDDLRRLCTHLAEAVRTNKHVVIYLLTPGGALPTSLNSPIVATLQQLQRTRHVNQAPLVYPLPLSAIADSRTMFLGDSSTARLDRLAFAVYDQLLVPIAKLRFPAPETFPSAPPFAVAPGPSLRLFQFPAIKLSPARKPQIQFELNWPASSLEVTQRHRILHIGYSVTPIEGHSNLEWVVASCIDEKGELWRTIPKVVRCPPGVSPEAARVKIVIAMLKTFADVADVEWRVVITRLGLLTKMELKAWHVYLKSELAAIKRPWHVTVACSDLQPPLSVVHLPTTISRPSSVPPIDAEEGEVTRGGPVGTTVSIKPPHLEAQSSLFAFTPSEPIAISPTSDLIAPASTYLIHVPRIASLAHTLDLDPLLIPPASSPSISILGLHLVTAFATPTSSLDITLAEHLADIRQSFTEMSALGQARWGTSGRIPWHLEAVATVGELLKQINPA